MVLIKNVLFFLPVVAAVEFAQLILDSVTIDQNIKSLNTAISSWDKSQTIFGLLTSLQDEQTLEKSITPATSNAHTSAPLTTDQAANMGALITDHITPDTQNLLYSLEAKKQDFKDVGALGIVQNSITTLRTDQAAYSNALLAVTPTVDQDKGKADAAAIDELFAEAVAFFAT